MEIKNSSEPRMNSGCAPKEERKEKKRSMELIKEKLNGEMVERCFLMSLPQFRIPFIMDGTEGLSLAQY